jgi:hypothetical protein
MAAGCSSPSESSVCASTGGSTTIRTRGRLSSRSPTSTTESGSPTCTSGWCPASVASSTCSSVSRVTASLPADTDLLDDPSVTCWQDPAVSPVTPLDRQRLLETDDCAARLELLDDLLVGTEEVLTFQLLDHP